MALQLNPAEKFLALSKAAAASAGQARDREIRTTFETLAIQWKSLAELHERLARSRALLDSLSHAQISNAPISMCRCNSRNADSKKRAKRYRLARFRLKKLRAYLLRI